MTPEQCGRMGNRLLRVEGFATAEQLTAMGNELEGS